jgi:hypothetical protein
MSQVSIPTEITNNEVLREKSLGGSIALCLKAAGYEPKEAMDAIKVNGKPLDKAQWSRWESGSEGVIWPKFTALMDFCGNDAPLLWMLNDRGYDLESIRKRETEIQKENRLLKEQNMHLKALLGVKA